MNVEIAQRLVDLRRKTGLSQEDLAEKLSLSRQTISKWERAESAPDMDNLIALARLYSISLDNLLSVELETEGGIAFAITECSQQEVEQDIGERSMIPQTDLLSDNEKKKIVGTRKTFIAIATTAIVCLLIGGGTVTLYNEYAQKNLAIAEAKQRSSEEELAQLIKVAEAPWVELAGSLPDAGINQPYRSGFGISASGPMELKFELLSGELPPGLALDQGTGTIAGVATEEGLFTFDIRVFNPESGAEDTQTVVLAVGKGGPVGFEGSWIELHTSLADAGINQPYKAYIGLGASEPMELKFELVSGELPPGLSLDQSKGIISGTATEEGLFIFDIRAFAPGSEVESTATFALVVGQGGPVDPDKPWVELHGGKLADGHLGKGYSESVGAGASSPMALTYEIAEGTLPPGIEFRDGTFKGVPTEAGDYKLTVKVSNLDGTAESSALVLISIYKD